MEGKPGGPSWVHGLEGNRGAGQSLSGDSRVSAGAEDLHAQELCPEWAAEKGGPDPHMELKTLPPWVLGPTMILGASQGWDEWCH